MANRVLKADNTSVADSYAVKSFAPQSEVWVTLHIGFDAAALAHFDSVFSGDFVDLINSTAPDDLINVYIESPGADPISWHVYGELVAVVADAGITANTCLLLELHWLSNSVAEFYVNGDLIASAAVPNVLADRVLVGSNLAGVGPAAIQYVDTFKVGTTRGGAEIFSDGFESGDLSAWDSTVGDVSVVNEPFAFNCSTAPTLTVTKDGSGFGTVTSSPSGISCGSDCSQDYADGTVVTLTAVASPGSVFAGWSGGGCGGTGTCVVTMDFDVAVTATFDLVADDANTTCETAATLTGTTGTREGDNTAANDWTAPDPLFSDPLWGLGYGGGGPLWWKYTNPYSRTVVLQLFLAESSTDPIERATIGVFRGSCGALYAAEVADTGCGGRSFSGYTADVLIPNDGQHVVDAIVAPGETVYVEVDGYSGDTAEPPTLAEPNRGRFLLHWEVHTISLSDAIEESSDYALNVCDDLYGGHTKVEDGSYIHATISDPTVQNARPDDLVEFDGNVWYTGLDRASSPTLSPVAKVVRWDGAATTLYELPTKGNWYHRDGTGGEDTDVLLNTDGETLWAVLIEDGGPTGDGWPNPGFGSPGEPMKWRPAHPAVFRYDAGLDEFVWVGAIQPRSANTLGATNVFDGVIGGLDSTAHPSMPGRLYVIWSEKGSGETLFADDSPPAFWVEHMVIGCFGDDAPFAEFDVGLSQTPGVDANIPDGFTRGNPPYWVPRYAAMLANDQGVCQVFRIEAQTGFPVTPDPYQKSFVRCEQVEDAGTLTLKQTINYVKPPGSTLPEIPGPHGFAVDLSLEPVCHTERPPVPLQSDSWVFVAEGSDFPGNHPDYDFLIANGISGVLWLDTDDHSAAGMDSTRAAGLSAGIWVVAGNDEDPIDFAERASSSVDLFKPSICVLDCEVVAKGFPPDDPGWLWSETMMERWRARQPQQNTAVTMLPLQDDFNYEAYWSRGAAIWPQSYGTNIPADDLDPIVVRDRVLANGVPPGFVKVVLPYDPWGDNVVQLRDNGIYTFAIFTAEGMEAVGGGPPPTEPPPSPTGSLVRTIIVGWVAGTDSSSGGFVGGLAYNVSPLLDVPWRWYNDNVQQSGDAADVNLGQALATSSGDAGAGVARRTLYTDRFGQTWGFLWRGSQAVFFDRNCGPAWVLLHMPRIDGEITPAPQSFGSGRQVQWHESDGDYVRTVIRDGVTEALQLGHVQIIRKWEGCGEPGDVFEPPTVGNPYLALRFRAQSSDASPADPTDFSPRVHLSGIRFRTSEPGAAPAALDASAGVHLTGISFRAEE